MLFRGFILTALAAALVLCVLFVWRSWRRMPGLAVLAAALAVLVGSQVLKNPLFAGLTLAGILLAVTALPRKRR